MEMKEDGILWITFDGDLEGEELDDFLADYLPHLEAADPENPLRTYSVSTRPGKYSSAVRKKLAELNSDPRLGKSATIGLDRYTRVLAGFVLKATGRNNIRFFDTEEQALEWLRSDE